MRDDNGHHRSAFVTRPWTSTPCAATLRSDEGRAKRWKYLLAWVQHALVAAAPEHIMDLRVREVCRRRLNCQVRTDGADILLASSSGGPPEQAPARSRSVCIDATPTARSAASVGPHKHGYVETDQV